MDHKSSYILRRMIGKVNIFDLFGEVDGDWSNSMKVYMESYIRECKFMGLLPMGLLGPRNSNNQNRSVYFMLYCEVGRGVTKRRAQKFNTTLTFYGLFSDVGMKIKDN